MVEIGGEVVVQGLNVEGKKWRLGINTPKAGTKATAIYAVVELENGALATSGSYRNYFDKDGKRYHHIIDPTTGYPVDHRLVSATIVSDECATADALATAAIVLGEDKMRLVLKEHFPKAKAFFIHQEKDLSLVSTFTEGFPLKPVQPSAGSK